MQRPTQSVRTSALAIGLLLFAGAGPAKANVFQDLWGIATDPLKIGRASAEISESAQRTLIQLDELERIANIDIKDRLEQVRSILNDTLAGTQEAIGRAEIAMRLLEEQVDRDAIQLMYRAQCLTEVALNDQIQRGFSALISEIKEADPGISILGVKIGGVRINEVDVQDPDIAYRSVRDIKLEQLRKMTSEKTPAWYVLSTYQNLERIAKLTQCHYLDQGLEQKFVQEINNLERLSQPWLVVVDVKL